MKKWLFVIIISSLLILSAYKAVFNSMFYPMKRGFAVDENGLVYIGEYARICVYLNNREVGFMNVTDRAYGFTILEGHILKYVDGTAYYIELRGIEYSNWKSSVIDSKPDPHMEEFNTVRDNKAFTDVMGAEYTIRKVPGGYRIVKTIDSTEEVVYEKHHRAGSSQEQ